MPQPRSSPLAMALLALLYEEPMHPYRMLCSSRLPRQRRDRQRSCPDEHSPDAGSSATFEPRGNLARPRMKKAGRSAHVSDHASRSNESAFLATRDARRSTQREFPQFPAALAFLALITPEDAVHHLQRRCKTLESEMRRLEKQLRDSNTTVPRLFLVETEYARTMARCERDWTRALIEDLESGRLTWNEKWLRELSQAVEQGFSDT